jgi:hypothetical protein
MWKYIEGYEGHYLVTDEGIIKSLKPKYFGIIMKYRLDKDGYCIVNLCKDGIKKTEKLHRLVAIAFILNSNNLPEVNHKDGDKQNNAVSNLEWCNDSYNKKHAYDNNLRESRKGKTNKFNKRVIQMDLSGNVINEFGNIEQAAKAVKVSTSYLSMCLNGKNNNDIAAGFKWRKEKIA